MQTVVVNNAAVIVAALAQFAIGFFWYGPLFGKAWLKLIGVSASVMGSAKGSDMVKPMIISLIQALITAYVLAHVLAFAETKTVYEGLQGAFWVWLGFVATTSASSYVWDPTGKKNWKLWKLDNGYYLASLLAMSAIIAAWV